MGRGPRVPIGAVLPVAEAVAAKLRESWPDVTVCGSIRRKEPSVKDIDVLVVGSLDRGLVLQKIREVSPEVSVESDREGKARQRYTVFPNSRLPLDVDVWVVPESRRGAGLLYCTGPGILNTVMRRWARFKGLRLSLEGVADRAGKVLACATEEECCAALGWPFVPPEGRAHALWVEVAAPFLDQMGEADFT